MTSMRRLGVRSGSRRSASSSAALETRSPRTQPASRLQRAGSNTRTPVALDLAHAALVQRAGPRGRAPRTASGRPASRRCCPTAPARSRRPVRGRSAIRRWIFSARRAVQREALVDQRAVVGDRVAVAGQHQVHVHLARRGAASPGTCTSACGRSRRAVARPGDQRVRGDVAEQVVGGDQDAPLAVVEDRVGGAVAGAVVHVQRAVAQLERLAVAQRARHVDARAPGAERARDRLRARATTSSGIPLRSITSRAKSSSACGLVGEVLDERHGQRRSPPPRRRSATRRATTSPRWSMCWWVTITSSMSSSEWPSSAMPRCSSSNEVPEFGPGVDQRQRLVLDQVDVHAPDRERRGDREPVDARPRRRAGDRGSSVTSGSARAPRRACCLHVLARDERLEVEPQQRLGVRRAHVEVPVVVVDRDAVEPVDARRPSSARRSRCIFAVLVGDLGVDLARDEVARAAAARAARSCACPRPTAARGSAAPGSCPSRRSRSRGSSSGRRPRRRTRRPSRACAS